MSATLVLHDIHADIVEKLDHFIQKNKTPNIIFHGPSGSGKRTLVHNFIQKLYNHDASVIKTFAMYVNCAHGKGIKFVREELKFFAKTHIHLSEGRSFKSVILMNADNLTTDAQSALRRCIELFSHTTRFFIIVEDKYQILKPILSRFCEIYVPEPVLPGVPQHMSLHQYNVEMAHSSSTFSKPRLKRLRAHIIAHAVPGMSMNDIYAYADDLYEKGYSGMDLLELLKSPTFFQSISVQKKYEQLMLYNKVRREIRNEKLLLSFVLYFLVIGSNESLVNISFM